MYTLSSSNLRCSITGDVAQLVGNADDDIDIDIWQDFIISEGITSIVGNNVTKKILQCVETYFITDIDIIDRIGIENMPVNVYYIGWSCTYHPKTMPQHIRKFVVPCAGIDVSKFTHLVMVGVNADHYEYPLYDNINYVVYMSKYMLPFVRLSENVILSLW